MLLFLLFVKMQITFKNTTICRKHSKTYLQFNWNYENVGRNKKIIKENIKRRTIQKDTNINFPRLHM